MATSVGVPLQNLNEPVIFVIKKNSSTLKNLLGGLRSIMPAEGTDRRYAHAGDRREADNASINISHDKGEVSRINGHIREPSADVRGLLLHRLHRNTFANIFIDPDTDDEMYKEDLFPRNFIVSLDPPTNYFGRAASSFRNPGDLFAT